MDVFTSKVFLLAGEKKIDQAIEACRVQQEKVGDHKGALAMIHNLKGGLYLSNKDVKRAEAAFQKAISENPNYPQPYYALAGIYIREENTDAAISQYETLLSKNPRQTRPNLILGIIHDQQKKFDLAEKYYRAALDIDPEFVPAANNLAYLLAFQDRNMDEALGLARKAKEKMPKSPDIMDTLGLVYYKKGIYDSAISEFSDALEKMPENAVVRYHLGMAYYKKGENAKARTELTEALGLSKSFDGADEAQRVLAEL